MKSTPIPASLFIRNREKMAGSLASGSLAVIMSAKRMPRNGDQFYPFRQGSDFFYLTGINLEECILVLCPHHADPSLRETLFIPKTTARSELWSGPSLTRKEAESLSGIREIRWADEVDAFLKLVLPGASMVYADQKEMFENDQDFAPLSPHITRLRMVKETEEVEEIKKATRITRSAFLKVLERAEPGTMEYQLEAEIIGEFTRSGANGHAYEPIVASGKNALILHYIQNHSMCQDGDLVLMDFGAELNNYAADCSRTIPVNGRFSKRQMELYEAVLRVFKQAMKMMNPGVIMADFHNDVGALWEEEHLKLGLYTSSDVASQTKADPIWKRYYMHGTTHSLGLDVHDPFDRSQPFEPGMVLTCEPGIYIREEGTGIRLENDILITENGPVDLMKDIPIEAAHIEELMSCCK
ncbi:MAG: aminopeptidase P family protein [Bacteroidetes bacterium]|nr:MAG: aminopeptidase P family protein [Bacteroidota bacterium]